MLNRPIPRRLKFGILGLSVIVVIGTFPLLLMCPRESNTQKQSRGYSEPPEPNTITIVPGLRVGDYTLGMSKDELLKKLGEPKSIIWNGESYTLNNLPRSCYMYFGGIAFEIFDDSVKSIVVYSPLYKFTNGLGVGDSEEKIMQAFGNNFRLRETAGKAFLTYEDEGIKFEIHKKKRTVMEITVKKKISRGHEDSSVKPIQSVKEFDGVRSKDLSKLDLSSGKGLIATLEFNQETLRPTPDRLPEEFGPKTLLQKSMNSGLGIRALHADGITPFKSLYQQVKRYQAQLKEYVRSKDAEGPESLHLLCDHSQAIRDWGVISKKPVSFDIELGKL